MDDVSQIEADVITKLAEEYRAAGYLVHVAPTGDELPQFLHGLSPDLVALGGRAGNYIVEVKHRGQRNGNSRSSELAAKVASIPDWHFRLVIVGLDGSRADARGLASETWISSQLDSAAALLADGHVDAALVKAWATFEAAGRRRLAIEDATPRSAPKNGLEMVHALIYAGVLGQDDNADLRASFAARNSVVHGVPADLDASAVRSVLDATRFVMARNEAAPAL